MSKIFDWIKSQAPKRESWEENRFLKPFAKRIFVPALWRFTRRSVPRGVALGLLVGIFLMIPGLQIVGAALLALPFRANIPIAAAMTFLSMPATTPFILIGSVYVGNATLGLRADMSKLTSLVENNAPLAEWTSWLFSEAAPAMLAGLFIIAVAAAIIGYVLSVFLWRWWIVRKWSARLHRTRRTLPLAS
jgi:uncharacterized protein